jgi:16S rRNA processing protein RimM
VDEGQSGQAGEGRDESRLITVGRCGAPYGVKGWLRISSDTQPRDTIFALESWQVAAAGGPQAAEVEAWREHGRHLVAKLKGFDSPEAITALKGATIQVERRCLPEPESDEYYWCDLVGLQVVTEDGEKLGEVLELFETGSNDVMVVGEYNFLIPFVLEQVVKEVDFEARVVRVDWDVNY